MRHARLAIAAFILFAGIVHIGLTPLLYQPISLDAMWFATSGLALILIAFINYMLIHIKPTITFFVVGHTTNILGLIALGLIMVYLPEPHVILVFVLLLIETALVIWSHITTSRKALS